MRSEHEGEEQRHTDKHRGSNREALADRRRGIAGSIQTIRPVPNPSGEAGHFCNPTRIVRNGAVRVNSQSNGQGAEHANARHGDAEGTREMQRNYNGRSEEDQGQDARFEA